MDNKYKYKKYLSKLQQFGGSSITDNIINDNCESPQFIRVLRHPITQKMIILLGETHSRFEATRLKEHPERFKRIDSKKGADLILGQISKRISNAHDKPENPFHKVLLLLEKKPDEKFFGGADLKIETGFIDYISSKFSFIQSKYNNILYKNVDIRKSLPISIRSLYDLIDNITEKYDVEYSDEEEPYVELPLDLSNLNGGAEVGLDNSEKDRKYINDINDFFINNILTIINKYIFDDEPFRYPLNNDQNKDFFGIEYEPTRLSEVCIKTKELYNHLKQLIKNELDREPIDQLTNPELDHLDFIERVGSFQLRLMNLLQLTARLMDLYILEYIHLMPNNTTTVIYSGALHSRFLFNELIILDGYDIVDLENKNYTIDNICNRTFPMNPEAVIEINKYYNDARNLYNKKVDKTKFINNLLLLAYKEDPNNTWENKIAYNPNELFDNQEPGL